MEERVELVEFEEFKNQFVLKALLEQECLAHAVFHIHDDILYLTWIETHDEYRGKGLGFKLLNYLAAKALTQQLSIAIIVIDEYTIRDFYLAWFSSRCNATEEDMPKVREKFQSLLNQGDTPSLMLTREDLKWQIS